MVERSLGGVERRESVNSRDVRWPTGGRESRPDPVRKSCSIDKAEFYTLPNVGSADTRSLGSLVPPARAIRNPETLGDKRIDILPWL